MDARRVDERNLPHPDHAHLGPVAELGHQLLELRCDAEEVRAVDLVYLDAPGDGQVFLVYGDVQAGARVDLVADYGDFGRFHYALHKQHAGDQQTDFDSDGQYAGQTGHRDVLRQRHQEQQDQQQHDRVDDSGYRRPSPVVDVGHRAGDRSRCGNTAEQRRHQIGRSLRDQFGIRVVAVACYADSNDSMAPSTAIVTATGNRFLIASQFSSGTAAPGRLDRIVKRSPIVSMPSMPPYRFRK